MQYQIRQSKPQDEAGLLALLPRLASFELPAGRQPEHLWQDDAKLLVKHLAGDAPQCFSLSGVDENGAVHGLALVSLQAEFMSHEPSAHLEALAVSEEAQGSGLGSRLLAQAQQLAKARGALSMTLHVFANNERARGLYDRNGFSGELLRYVKALD